MQHLVGFYQSVDQGNAYGAINGVPDSILYVVGADVRVPAELPFLAGGSVLTDATTYTEAQFRSPTLREIMYPNIAPRNNSIAPAAAYPNMAYFPGNPLGLTALEQLNLWTNTDNAGVANIYGLAWLQDGPQAPVAGEILTVRCTAAATLVQGQWVNSNLTFGQVLPVGDYQVVGMRAEGTNLVAARLVFQGYSWRPGVQAINSTVNADNPMNRYGMSGVLGQFNNNVPPTVDCLGNTDTTQRIYLDLIKVG